MVDIDFLAHIAPTGPAVHGNECSLCIYKLGGCQQKQKSYWIGSHNEQWRLLSYEEAATDSWWGPDGDNLRLWQTQASLQI